MKDAGDEGVGKDPDDGCRRDGTRVGVSLWAGAGRRRILWLGSSRRQSAHATGHDSPAAGWVVRAQAFRVWRFRALPRRHCSAN